MERSGFQLRKLGPWRACWFEGWDPSVQRVSDGPGAGYPRSGRRSGLNRPCVYVKAQVVACSDCVVVPPKRTTYPSAALASYVMPADWTAGTLEVAVFVRTLPTNVQ